MSLTTTSIKHDIIPNVLCTNTKITLIKMASFSSYLLVFFLVSLILIPQGFGSHPQHDRKHPPSTQGFDSQSHHDHPKHPPSTQGFGSHPIHPTNFPNIPKKHPTHPPKEDNTLPKPTYPASTKPHPHHPPKEDNTLPKPTYPASFPKKSPHHPPKEDNTHF
jgi:hypothetical protein